MTNKLVLTTKLTQKLQLNQQLQQAINLLQYSTIELRDYVKQQLEENPILEMEEDLSDDFGQKNDFHHYERSFKSQSIEDNVIENYAQQKTLRDHLFEQTLLCRFNAIEQVIAESIIDSLDDNGRLLIEIAEILNLVGLNREDEHLVEMVLKRIQRFDPCGVASRDLQECLLIQLEQNTNKTFKEEVAYRLVKDHLNEFGKVNPHGLIKKMGLSQSQFEEAINCIRMLNPYPGKEFADQNELIIEPELYVRKVNGKWRIYLTDSILTRVKINQEYHRIIGQHKKEEAYSKLREKLQETKLLLSSIGRRNETLLSVGTFIVEKQADFLEHGHTHMKPMNMAEVAMALGVHESTVSRITTGKYIATPIGMYELKFFFPSYVTGNNGATCSATAVKALIQQMINNEEPKKILSDLDIANILKDKGIHISRRTVTKYREAMNLPSSYERTKYTLIPA